MSLRVRCTSSMYKFDVLHLVMNSRGFGVLQELTGVRCSRLKYLHLDLQYSINYCIKETWKYIIKETERSTNGRFCLLAPTPKKNTRHKTSELPVPKASIARVVVVVDVAIAGSSKQASN